jgi:hypothetical protein
MVFQLAKGKFNAMPTTASERQKFRDETISALAGRGIAIPKKPTKSFNRLLRQAIPKRREILANQEMARKKQEAKWGDQRAHQALEHEVEQYRRLFGGYSSTDNPQTRARAARFAKENRRLELERKSGTDLRDIVYDLTVLTNGAELHSKDPELYRRMRQLYSGIPIFDSLFTLRVKNELIEVILKAETILNGTE